MHKKRCSNSCYAELPDHGISGVKSHLLEVDDIVCRHDSRTVVDHLSFAVAEGALTCLLGPSGSGKTTVLRAIAGFQALVAGRILPGGQTVSQPGFVLAPEQRQVGMVFQDHALFPHLTVSENIAFGLRGAARSAWVHRLLEGMGLVGLEKRYPHELSGGQQQRVALARALAPRPKLMLMDEPFSSLDLDLRERLSNDVRELLKQQGTTCVMVTHDQHDAFALSDRVGVIAEGRILQWDTPYNLYHEPANRFVANFIGDGVFLEGTLIRPDTVETELGVFSGDRAYGWGEGAKIDVLIRPDDIVPDSEAQLTAEVVRKAFKGAEILYTLRLANGRQVLSMFPSHANHSVGDQVGIRLQADHLVAFPRDG